jgi:acetyl-CoA acyltransferase
MRDALILSAVRTPVGRHRGALASVRPDDLAGLAIAALVSRAGSPAIIDEVVLGCANQAGEDNRNVARMATLLAGLPYEVPAVTVNRLCGSGLEAVVQAARSIATGDADLVIAGGVESMTRAPWALGKPPEGFAGGPQVLFDTSLGWRFPNPRLAARFPLEQMGETAENVAERYRVSREDQDAFALESHQRALTAQKAGKFEAELVAVEVVAKKGAAPQRITADEGPRSDTSLEKLAQLKPVFREGGTVTAGNSSPLNDGAAVLLLGTAERAKELGLEPMARIVASASAGVDPRVMGIGPVPATRKALARAGWKASSLDLVELNEAFAAQSLACLRELELDPARVNVNGGAIALGHPLGASGARILTTLVHEMKRRPARRGLATMCIGVGQGIAVLIDAA